MPANISQTTPRWLDNNLITHLIPLATGRRQKPEAMRPGQICAQPITVQTTKTGRSKNGSEHGFENGSEHGFVVFLAQRSPHLSPAHDTRLSHAPDNACPTENYFLRIFLLSGHLVAIRKDQLLPVSIFSTRAWSCFHVFAVLRSKIARIFLSCFSPASDF